VTTTRTLRVSDFVARCILDQRINYAYFIAAGPVLLDMFVEWKREKSDE
jgi:hypothetical protein